MFKKKELGDLTTIEVQLRTIDFKLSKQKFKKLTILVRSITGRFNGASILRKHNLDNGVPLNKNLPCTQD
jgi:hypothetical protein